MENIIKNLITSHQNVGFSSFGSSSFFNLKEFSFVRVWKHHKNDWTDFTV